MKKVLYILLLSPIFFISSCDEDIRGCTVSFAVNYNEDATIFDNSCEYIEIGDIYQGGIVFYVDETGQHGLVAAMEYLTEGASELGFHGYEWGCYQEYVEGADGTSIGSGYANTMDIVNQGCETLNGGITAAQASIDYESGGYSDWYLPSKDELVEMYNTIGNGGSEGNIGGFVNSDWNLYWSSSDYGSNNAWDVDFSVGYAGTIDKNYTFRVRVIRSF